MDTTRRLRIVALAAAAIGLAGVGVVAESLWANLQVPETPANALLDFGSDVVLGDYGGAWDRLCSRLKADALGGQGEEFAALQALLRHEGNVYTDFETRIDGDTAAQPISVQPRGARDDRSNERWVAHLVKEHGKWRVCGVERVRSRANVAPRVPVPLPKADAGAPARGGASD